MQFIKKEEGGEYNEKNMVSLTGLSGRCFAAVVANLRFFGSISGIAAVILGVAAVVMLLMSITAVYPL